MTKDLNLEAVNGVLSREVRKLQEELKLADQRIIRLMQLAALGASMRQSQKASASVPRLDIEVQSILSRAEEEFDTHLAAILADAEAANG